MDDEGVLGAGQLKGLRGTPFDLFGYTHERRTERQLVRDFEARIEEIVAELTPANHAVAVGLANIPQKIRGFGHIKERNLAAAKAEEASAAGRSSGSGKRGPSRWRRSSRSVRALAPSSRRRGRARS